jgi:seryl-tRNA synthetase
VQGKLRTDKMADAVTPLVTRIAQDEELRAHAKTALDSARTIYNKIQSEGARSAASRKDVQDEVVKAAAELKKTATRLAEPKPKKSHRLRKLLIGSALVVGAVAAAKQLIHRDEDEFDYEP